ncbi:MAG: NAD(P)-binding domain-containing protein [Bacilli bacterium]|nr:NAD(P)-binding domain-containing protein [Bacilli bacterium]
MNIAIIGTGAFSLSMLNNLNAESVRIWTHSNDIALEFKKTKKFDSIIKGVKAPKDTIVSTDYAEVLENANIVFLMTASKYIVDVATSIKPYLNKKTIVFVGTKGLLEGGVLIHDGIRKILPTKKILYISGPNYSADLIKGNPIGINIAGDLDVLKSVSTIFNNNVYIDYTEDIDGILLCGAMKNVFAIGSGILDGLKYGQSTKYFYITRLTFEMRKIIHSLGGYRESMYSLAGLGDLMLTCSMKESRNYTFGKELGSKKIKDVKKYIEKNTTEGYFALACLNELVNSKKVQYKILNSIYRIVYENEDPNILVDALLKK